MLPMLIVNGQRQPLSPAKPSDMLLQHPKGPYTTAHVTAGLHAEAWQQHMLRLARAVLRLHQLDADNFQRLVASLQVRLAQVPHPAAMLKLIPNACVNATKTN